MNEPNESAVAVPAGQAGHTGAVEASAGGGTDGLRAAQQALEPIASAPVAAPAHALTAITSEEQLRAALQNAPGKVLLDFVSKDCEACDAEKPLLANLNGACTDTTILTVDVDELPHIADALKADGTPTLYLGEGADFLKDLERGSKALEEDKRVPRPSHVKEVNPEDPKLLRRLKCARTSK